MNEAKTRAEHIAPAMKASGWGVIKGSRILRKSDTIGHIKGHGKRGKALTVDYAGVPQHQTGRGRGLGME
ncbi:MAG: hypothetical protein A3J49_17300 [Gallionellales bacterium RIFCSPHIGHO2_02_FULL_57_16]|nr:MAG: hypothetical protein A3J49_17300 [Gallionellales bacterium RIFCSPHIGHO2_02_FULL_57_16]